MRAAARHLARAARRRREVALALPRAATLAPAASAAAGPTPRHAATTTTSTSTIDDVAYHAAADATLADLTDALEAWVDDGPAGAALGGDADVECATGVLTIRLGGTRGTYVINKQAPNKQIWFSSPVSGPFRYDLIGGRWIYARDGHDMVDKLRSELTELVGTAPPL